MNAQQSAPPMSGQIPPSDQNPVLPSVSGDGSISTASRLVLIGTAIVGALALVAVIATTLVARALASDGEPFTKSMAVGMVSEVKIDTSGAQFSLQFDDVSQVVLEGQGATRGDWVLEQSGETLNVRAKQQWCFFWCPGSYGVVTLTLPNELAKGNVGLDVSLSGGAFSGVGDFGEVDIDIAAGSVDVQGSASALNLDLSAGYVKVDLADVTESRVNVSAGRAVVGLTGTPPLALDLRVSAGSVEVFVPHAVYRVESNVLAGSFDNGLYMSQSSKNVIDVEVSAGSLAISPVR